MEDKKIFRREKLSIVGLLKDNNVATTAYNIDCEVIGPNGKLALVVPLDINSDGTYSGIIDTEELLGRVRFRFVIKSKSGDKVISDSFIDKTIYP